MRIETQSSPTLTRQQRQDAASEELQNLFSEILTQSGKSGYASADAYESENTVEEDIQQTWDDWFALSNVGNYPDGVDAETLKTSYGELLVRTYNEGGYADPQGFLQSLEKEDLEVVQHINRLAKPIDTDSLSQEAAINLLLPRPTQIDLDFNGLTQVGAANTIRFPNSRTPEAVVNAWNETTAGMSLREKMTYELQMSLPTMLANIEVDENGRFVSQREPGDPGWVNPMASPDYSYVDFTQQMLDYLDYFKNQIPPDQHEQQTSFYQAFQQALQENKAP
ncbi:hypothetical protein [Bremerella cremea]|uniref:hypothetical protein n=1 Tax=Bremerella cremea TaxID=1031537 RepID=UPI0031EFC8DB